MMKQEQTNQENDHSGVLSVTFHIESLRVFAHFAFVVMLFIGAMITEFSGLNTIPAKEDTAIFKIFGFNHACNWIDHNPSRMIAGILIPTFQLPMIAYIILFHLRLAKSVKEGDCSAWFLSVSRIVSPFNLFVISQLHMWFVNNPDDDYGFIAHYTPYLLFQITLSFIGVINMQYLISKGSLPCNVKPVFAWIYQGLFITVTIILIMSVISMLAGNPIWDTVNNLRHRMFLQTLSFFYAFLLLIVPIIFAAIERRNGDTITLRLD